MRITRRPPSSYDGGMTWTHLRPVDGRRMPWKNGGGVTLELAVDPPEATLESGFRWRLSSAEVGVSGPFSRFQGLERWLLLLEGAGFDLDFGAHGRVRLQEPLVPVRFSGDWPASATLIDGPCTDFNLMVDPRICTARLEVLHLKALALLPPAAGTRLLFVARGTLAVPELGLDLGLRHTLRLDQAEGPLHLVPAGGGAASIVIELAPV